MDGISFICSVFSYYTEISENVEKEMIRMDECRKRPDFYAGSH